MQSNSLYAELEVEFIDGSNELFKFWSPQHRGLEGCPIGARNENSTLMLETCSGDRVIIPYHNVKYFRRVSLEVAEKRRIADELAQQ